MPPSQLKRLKSSLREQGVTGPQKSKKQKKDAKGSRNTADRNQREANLQQLRDAFNPFEIKAPSRPSKFEHATPNGPSRNGSYKDVLHRPGVAKSAGEELRKKTLLPEMQRRNKVGGLVDRRIGEGDPGMTAEERAVQRFAREKEGRKKAGGLFNLEGSDDEGGIGLTHGGKNIADLPADDFNDALSDESDGEDIVRKKRQRDDQSEDDMDAEAGRENGQASDEPQRKKSKHEVMQEVIAKSKLHKYERQKVKEDDEDLREELDGKMDDMLAILRGHKAPRSPSRVREAADGPNEPSINPDRQRLLDGLDRGMADKEYDARLKQLALDTRAKPSNRTKTEEEKVIEEAKRLKNLEERRIKRMQGEDVSDHEGVNDRAGDKPEDEEEQLADEAAEFGFTNANAPSAPSEVESERLVLDDEDEFALDDDLIGSGSDVDFSEGTGSEQESDSGEDAQPEEDEEDEFVTDILGTGANGVELKTKSADGAQSSGVAFTYPCPRSHDELLDVIRDTPVEQLPTIVQRIRALYHPSLAAANKEGMADFASVLVEHLAYMGEQRQPLAVAEQVIRHLHSLSRTYTETIANAYRRQLLAAHERKDFNGGDLIILTAIGSTYPTSDHFHQVVTPATALMARWLGLTAPDTARNSTRGAFLVALCLKYQTLSKRYIPEAVRFTFRALASNNATSEAQRKLHAANLITMAEMWQDKSAFIEIFTPALPFLKSQSTKRDHQTLRILLQQSRLRRRPLALHHHRPLAIRTSVPKFEENFDPNKHYDPDKERSEAKRLEKEYKRERKGALRELRKDANFVARQQLQEKKTRDAEYEKKYRRLVAEIQGEEGHEAKEYDKQKERRKRQK